MLYLLHTSKKTPYSLHFNSVDSFHNPHTIRGMMINMAEERPQLRCLVMGEVI